MFPALSLCFEEALMLSISFQVSLWWPVHIINPVDKSKLFCNTPHLGGTTVSLETLFVCLLKHHWYAHSILSVTFFIMRTCSKLPTPWRSNLSSPKQNTNVDWQSFQPMVFHFAQAKQKWKTYLQRSRQAHFLGVSSLPPCACDSEVSLLARYTAMNFSITRPTTPQPHPTSYSCKSC